MSATKELDVFWFAYTAPIQTLTAGGKNDFAKTGKVMHMERDGAAFAFVHGCLPRNCRFNDIIMNFPAGIFGKTVADEPKLPAGSLLVLSTRPPLNAEDDRKSVERSGTALEARVFDAIRYVVPYCTRIEVVLNAQLLKAHKIDSSRTHHEFRRYAPCTIVKRGESGSHLKEATGDLLKNTLGFLLYLPSIDRASMGATYESTRNREKPRASSGAGLGLLACFGMSGPATLIWSTLVAASTNETGRRSQVVGGASKKRFLDLGAIIAHGRNRLLVAEFPMPDVESAAPASVAEYAKGLPVRSVIDLKW